MNTNIKPRSWDAMHRAFNRTEAKTGAEHVVLFGGPENLIRLAHALANACDPPAERLICHPDDYAAAGLRRFGHETFIEIMPLMDRATMFKPWDGSRTVKVHKAALRPAEGCPRGEVHVIG